MACSRTVEALQGDRDAVLLRYAADPRGELLDLHNNGHRVAELATLSPAASAQRQIHCYIGMPLDFARIPCITKRRVKRGRLK